MIGGVAYDSFYSFNWIHNREPMEILPAKIFLYQWIFCLLEYRVLLSVLNNSLFNEPVTSYLLPRS